ncbi:MULTISPECIES: DUF6048 family protein [unclassified Leeuwenhoekiella]|uniref:DUF6048 family protein n=1 Tax=unclassified Leeuwenhoekiella TaxID=2615029 RepID=UPI000C5DFE34|nr:MULTISPECIES: DUF6048 family protein [unclassified Leeuwenhoekiella]MAW95113.1 hypothetical protein [Leeuwenhoekiella sp.]MBA79833.1 hypothetical protein [Leeuwenhoekiella sp.]|tara:strand:+ start:16290 stop:17033 length:744 start_codon:yes stop_codon:yes gene_type:complete
MKILHRYILVINLCLIGLGSAFAQENQGVVVEEPLETRTSDTLVDQNPTEKYGLRAGIDLSKILRSFLEDNYEGAAILGDFRIKDRYYIAAEIGRETKSFDEAIFDAKTQGTYLKGGINYNAYNNWAGMSNLIYVGFHIGVSSFKTDLNQYTIYNPNNFFEPDVRTVSREYSGLNAIWGELQMGIQVEVLNNLYLGMNVQLKRMLSQKAPDDFTNIYAPGFNKITFDNVYGAGYGYSISYLLPIFKK